MLHYGKWLGAETHAASPSPLHRGDRERITHGSHALMCDFLRHSVPVSVSLWVGPETWLPDRPVPAPPVPVPTGTGTGPVPVRPAPVPVPEDRYRYRYTSRRGYMYALRLKDAAAPVCQCRATSAVPAPCQHCVCQHPHSLTRRWQTARRKVDDRTMEYCAGRSSSADPHAPPPPACARRRRAGPFLHQRTSCSTGSGTAVRGEYDRTIQRRRRR